MINILSIGQSVLWANSLLVTAKGEEACFYFDEVSKNPNAVLLNTQGYNKAQIEKILNRFSHIPVFFIHHNMNYFRGRIAGVFNHGVPIDEIERGILYFVSQHVHVEQSIPFKEQVIRTALVKGMSNKQIAQEYDLPLSTIKYYLSKTYQKLAVNSRTQAALMLQKSSL